MPTKNMHPLIAAIIFPIPLFHLWLHALLPVWRRHPVILYILASVVWAAAIIGAPIIHDWSPQLFSPSLWLNRLGLAIMALGFVLICASIITLGVKRFFVWAVLSPQSVEQKRILSCPFNFLPHPAYLGCLAIAAGNLMSSGKLYLLPEILYLFTLMPIIIWLEEHELAQRAASSLG